MEKFENHRYLYKPARDSGQRVRDSGGRLYVLRAIDMNGKAVPLLQCRTEPPCKYDTTDIDITNAVMHTLASARFLSYRAPQRAKNSTLLFEPTIMYAIQPPGALCLV